MPGGGGGLRISLGEQRSRVRCGSVAGVEQREVLRGLPEADLLYQPSHAPDLYTGLPAHLPDPLF